MAINTRRVELYAGDTFDPAFVLTDSNGVPLNLDLYTLTTEMRRDNNTPLLSGAVIKDVPLLGQGHLLYTPAQTATLPRGIHRFNLRTQLGEDEVKSLPYIEVDVIIPPTQAIPPEEPEEP